MRIFCLLTVLIITQYLRAQDSVSVLFIGNSYTYVNDLPTMIQSLATSLGKTVSQDSQTAGGATLSTHAGNSVTYSMINSKPWDYVVIQAQSQEPSFPDAQVNSQTLPYAIQLADSVYENNFCSETMFFMTWGYVDGDPQWAPISTYEGMQTRLRNAYVRFADSVQGSVSPVGMAWKYVRENYPSIDLYAADGSHPSYAGSYLAACTFYASLFRESPVGSTFYGSLDPVTAAQLQGAAAVTVLDSMSTWHVRPPFQHTKADFDVVQNGYQVDLTNNSWKAQSYFWDFGDGNTSTMEELSHTYPSDGTYTIKLIAGSECNTDSTQVTLVFNLGGIKDGVNDIMWSYSNNIFSVEGLMVGDELNLVDVSGNIVSSSVSNGKKITVDCSDFVKGVYIFTVRSKDKLHREKFYMH